MKIIQLVYPITLKLSMQLKTYVLNIRKILIQIIKINKHHYEINRAASLHSETRI